MGGIFGGGGDIDVERSPEERQLLREQLEILRENRRLQELLAPFLFEQFGLSPISDELGNIIGFEPLPGFEELGQQRIDIQRLFNVRALAGLRGDLPVSPALERELQRADIDLGSRIFRQFGPGGETSTPAQRGRAEFAGVSAALRARSREGGIATLGQLFGGPQAQAANVAGIAQIPGLPGGGAGGFADISQILQSDRLAQARLALGQQDISSRLLGDIFGSAALIATTL